MFYYHQRNNIVLVTTHNYCNRFSNNFSFSINILLLHCAAAVVHVRFYHIYAMSNYYR